MRFTVWISILLVIMAGPVYGMDRQEADILFDQAGQAYRKAEYEQAITLYAQILEGGWESGPLYYNLASSYFRMGDLGRAILNYERARHLVPRDPELRANDRYARSLRNPAAIEVPQTSLFRFLNIESGFLSVKEMTGILLVIFIFLGIAHALYLFGILPPKMFRAFFVGLTVIFVVFLFSVTTITIQNRNRAIILKETEARFEPRQEATAHFSLVPGQAVKITGVEDQWLKVKRMDGKSGWVKKDALEKI